MMPGSVSAGAPGYSGATSMVSTPLARQVAAEGADRGGDAVDARKVDVGDEQYPHAAPTAMAAPMTPLVDA